MIEAALQQGRFNQRKAAQLLGLTYHQLRGMLKNMRCCKTAKRTRNNREKSQHPSWLKNTGSNVSNVVPSTSEPQTVAFRELPGDDNSYQYRL
ncbi:hypothetical protein NFX37_15530 [Serratia marcescens]|nr:hypothetical protein NFX37_15530 [Serratia marcescens]